MTSICPRHKLTFGGFVRGLPYTLAGVLVGLCSLGHPRLSDGLLLFHARVGPAWLLLTRRNFVAITLGRVVITNQPELPPETLVHEQHHAMQFEQLGLLFGPVYLYWQARAGYWRNPFEVSAVRCAQQWIDEQQEQVSVG